MISQKFGVAPSVHVWCIPFTPGRELPADKDIWLVQRGKNEIVAFGNYAGTLADKKETTSFSVGVPLAKLTQDGKLTDEGMQYCMTYGVERDADSLAKWTRSQTPQDVKYEGAEFKPALS